MLKPTQRKRKAPNRIDLNSADAAEALGDDFTLPRTSRKRMKSLWESAELLLSESESVSESVSSRTEESFDRSKGVVKDPHMDDAITVISLLSLRQSTDRLTPAGTLNINTSLTGGIKENQLRFPLKSERFDLVSSSESSISFSEHSNSSSVSTSSKRYKPTMSPIKINFKFGANSVNGSPMFKSLSIKEDPFTSAAAGRPFMLQIAKHPPAKALYRRTLKPFPTVSVIYGDPAAAANSVNRVSPGVSNTQNMLVEAVLIREDSYELPCDYLDGVRIVPLTPSGTATFKKLKIMSTSQQLGGMYLRLVFRLKKYTGAGMLQPVTLPSRGPDGTMVMKEVIATSNPIEVFSHSQYLNNKTAGVTEVIPSSGPLQGGTKVVVLGYNFLDSKTLFAKFGEKEVPCQFHDENTLICYTPMQDTPALTADKLFRVNVEVYDVESGFKSHIPAEFKYVAPPQ